MWNKFSHEMTVYVALGHIPPLNIEVQYIPPGFKKMWRKCLLHIGFTEVGGIMFLIKNVVMQMSNVANLSVNPAVQSNATGIYLIKCIN